MRRDTIAAADAAFATVAKEQRYSSDGCYGQTDRLLRCRCYRRRTIDTVKSILGDAGGGGDGKTKWKITSPRKETTRLIWLVAMQNQNGITNKTCSICDLTNKNVSCERTAVPPSHSDRTERTGKGEWAGGAHKMECFLFHLCCERTPSYKRLL